MDMYFMKIQLIFHLPSRFLLFCLVFYGLFYLFHDNNKETTLTEHGKYVSVNLELLIERIYVAPKATQFFYEKVNIISGKFRTW